LVCYEEGLLAGRLRSLPAQSSVSSSRRSTRRSLHVPREDQPQPQTLSQRMRRKIDLSKSRKIYGQRLAIVEAVFANLRRNKSMDRFRGEEKVQVLDEELTAAPLSVSVLIARAGRWERLPAS
jgi:hypothetical protein